MALVSEAQHEINQKIRGRGKWPWENTKRRLFDTLFAAIILIIDWRCGRRYLYSHITQAEEDIRIDVDGNR
jgi:hypothetical protein